MKKLFTLGFSLMLFLLVFDLAFAQNFVVKTTPIKNQINLLEEAVFNITINNLMSVDDTYILSSLNDPRWRVYSQPLSDYLTGKHIDAKSSDSIILHFKPLQKLYNINYKLELNLKSKRTGDTLILPFHINIVPLKPTKEQYDTNIIMYVNSDEMIDPRKESFISVELKNKAVVDFRGLVLKVSSGLVNKELFVNLGPHEEKIIRIPLNLSPTQGPLQDFFRVILATPDGESIKQFSKPYAIIGYSEFYEEKSIKKGFLTKQVRIKVVNKGNKAANYLLKYRTNWFESMFSRTSPKAYYYKEGSKRYLSWNLKLAKGESAEVFINENYWPLFLLLLLLCINLVIYYIFRIPVVVKKEASVIKLKEGGISKLKVVISVKNRGSKPVSKVKLIDVIPNIAEVEKSLDIGPLKPEKVVKRSSRGTILKWDLGVLDKFDERIVSYKVKSKLSILGWFTLPAAIVKYSIKGKEFKVKSRKVRLGVGEK